MDDFFSDSDGDKAVEELLSQAMDSAVLEQVAAVNCAGFTDSGLPSHLETRFQRLKSFPASAPKPASSLSTTSFNLTHHPPQSKNRDPAIEPEKPDSAGEKGGERVPTTCSTKSPKEEKFTSDGGGSSFSPLKENPREKSVKKGRRTRGRKSVSSSWSSTSSSSGHGFSSRSVSPPVKTGCFLCSPKKVSLRKTNKNRSLDRGLDWGKNDELLSDLRSLSASGRRKMMKKAMEEEERVCREAEKIVKWAKQASARMDISGLEDELSDDENSKFH